MTISWYGLSSFKITTVGNEVTIITDPFSKDSGLTPPRGGADIVLVSKDTELHNNIEGVTGDPLIIRNGGEFDYKGVNIHGIYKNAPGSANPSQGEEGKPTTIYYLEVDGIKIGFLGALQARELTENQVESLNGADILIVPIGGGDVVTNWEWASHIVQQVEPKFVIPSFFDQTGLKMKLDDEAKFIKEMGGESRKEDRFTLKAKDIPEEKTEVIVLNPQR